MNELVFTEPPKTKRKVVVAESAIKEMLANVLVVSEPDMVVLTDLQAELVPEFEVGAVSSGEVTGVAQSCMKSTQEKPIRTLNVDKCNVMLVRHGEEVSYDLFHNQNGDMDQNAKGYRVDDVRGRYTDVSGILISSKKSLGTTSTMRTMRYRGVTTQKHIQIDSGKENISVVYRPKDNKIFLKIGESGDILEFKGFEDAASP